MRPNLERLSRFAYIAALAFIWWMSVIVFFNVCMFAVATIISVPICIWWYFTAIYPPIDKRSWREIVLAAMLGFGIATAILVPSFHGGPWTEVPGHTG